jgi:diaminohydroxyphosphoribosylaminopyrimidine deaminase/5-amino-6-(5-phosphoribosylamino)uracil reductase
VIVPDASEAMQQALLQAYKVEGRTSPRPPVGAVVVRDGRIVGQGATAPPYGPHAEVEALAMAGPLAAGADLYVTLEPCCVTIHTPPCTEAIIAAGIQRVFVGAQDPNPRVAGQGIAQLESAGITVHMQLTPEAEKLLQPFATYITRQRAYVTAKWAMTLDGKIATHTGDAHWISGLESRAWVHDLRDRVDAILVGANTVSIDDPQLTVRLTAEQQAANQRTPRPAPYRVIMTTSGILPEHLKLLKPDMIPRTILIVGETCPVERQQRWQDDGVKIVPTAVDARGRIDITTALTALAQQGIMHILLEGGAQLFGSAFDSRCIDHVVTFVAPRIIGGAEAPTPIAGTGLNTMKQAWTLSNRRIQQIGEDILFEGDTCYS